MILPWPMLGQNLVINGGFEDTLSCPNFGDQIWKAKGWFAVSGTPDLMNTCSSDPYTSIPHMAHKNLTSKSGNSVASNGLTVAGNSIVHYEYISSRLKRKLEAGHNYCIEFWMLTSDTNKYAVDKLGVLLTHDSLEYRDGRVLKQPQISTESGAFLIHTNWLKYTFNYRANGGEEYFTLGQFNELRDLKLDTLLENGSIAVWWFFDDISLIDCTPSLTLEIPNVFTPNGDGDNDDYYITLENVESAQITIFNRWGNAVYTSTNPNFVWDGTQNGNALAEGVYYIVVNAKGLDGEEVVEKQTVHLLR